MEFIPYPHSDLLAQAGKANFSLYFDKMSKWAENDGIKTFIDPMAGKANDLFPAASSVLTGIHRRQGDMLLGLKSRDTLVWEFRATLDAPFISGLGSGHPTETGMVLDRNSGLPFIPASSVKGVLRMACALMLAEKHPELVREVDGELLIKDTNPFLRRYFGDTKTDAPDTVRGQLVFMDAYPESVPRLNLDIMNPHLSKYYNGSAPPEETELPVPVKFLTVDGGTSFVFRGFVSPLAPSKDTGEVSLPFTGQDEEHIRDMFDIACTRLGFGAKTAIGYGRFDTLVKTSDEIWQDRLQQLENKIEAQRYPWRLHLRALDQVQNWGSLKNQVLENEALLSYQAKAEVGQAVAAAGCRVADVHRDNWDEARDEVMTAWLQASGTTWINQAVRGEEANPVTEQIKGFSAPANYDRSLDFSTLNQEQCALLNQKFKSWKWHTNKAKRNNQKLFGNLQKRIREL